MTPQRLDRWSKGERDSASKRNQSVDLINGTLPITGSAGINVTTSEGGTAISAFDPGRGAFGFRLGTIVSGGPGGEADYSDNRYWVNFGTLSGIAENDRVTKDVLDDWDDATDSGGTVYASGIVTATNLSESADGSHDLETNGNRTVQVFRVFDVDGVPHWVFNSGGTGGGEADSAVIQITGNLTGGGKYTALVVPRIDSVTSTSTGLTSTELGTAVTSVHAWNLTEVGSSDHAIVTGGTNTSNVFFPAHNHGTHTSGTTTTDVYVFWGRQIKVCT